MSETLPPPVLPPRPPRRATLDDLLDCKGKCELINGRIVEHEMPGDGPGEVAEYIFVSLFQYAKSRRRGFAHADGVDFGIPELGSGRESFKPDASFTDRPRAGPPSARMKWVQGPPTLAVEVRSDSDYISGADKDMAAKRADYFLAGTLVVWDVDTRAECVNVYRRSDLLRPTVYRRGQVAEAEPAVPGWSMPVDEVFPGE